MRGTDLPTRDLSQSLNRDGNAKFSNLLRRVPGKTYETDLRNEPLPRRCMFDAHRFVDDPAIARKERQRLAYVTCG